MSRRFGVITFLLAILGIVLAMTAMVSMRTVKPESATTSNTQEIAEPQDAQGSDSEDIQYVMYLGTNDKDTNEPVFTPEEAMERARDILINHFGGYTIQEANGGWVDGDKVYQEYTLIIYLSDTNLEQVHLAADDLVEVFNQSSVLIQANKTTTEFYAGKNS